MAIFSRHGSLTAGERIQCRLAKKGFLKSPGSGDFDDGTVRAIAAFQKTLAGYKATGFPDQATLFMLFAK
jgi:peptidoglycan hydrolase-like protein with peptidoglycan-binding domain